MSSLPYPADLYPGCPCFRCEEPTWPEIFPGVKAARMTLCPTCGNKRCPGAVNHDNECSGSNEPVEHDETAVSAAARTINHTFETTTNPTA